MEMNTFLVACPIPPRRTYPDHAIPTASDDDMACVPRWPLHHVAAGDGSFWAPGRGNAGQWLSVDIPQGQVGSRTGDDGALQQRDRASLQVGITACPSVQSLSLHTQAPTGCLLKTNQGTPRPPKTSTSSR